MIEQPNPDTNFKVLDRRSSETQARKAEMPDHPTDNTEMMPARCPFCGDIIKLQLCDKAGNFREASYEDNPRRGIGFQLVHEVKDGDCPIATHDGETLGSFIYNTREDAIAARNRRAPAPMTSVIEWRRYDGTPETLPEVYKEVLLFGKEQRRQFAKVKFDGFDWIHGTTGWDVQIGDLWAYLPTPPEGAA